MGRNGQDWAEMGRTGQDWAGMGRTGHDEHDQHGDIRGKRV